MDISSADIHTIASEATELIKEVGNSIKKRLGCPEEVRHKGEIDLVTEVDVEVEGLLKKGLKEIFEAEFLAEESASSPISSSPTWVIDPIDGTTNFAHGILMVATSVALCMGDNIYLGIINLPVVGETFVAIKGEGARLNGENIHVSSTSHLGQSLIATGFPYDIRERIDEIISPLRRVLLSSQGVRRMGAAAIDLAYVSCGRFDGFYEQGLKPWDVAAGILLVREAGGMVSEYDGKTPVSLSSPNILATNSLIHQELASTIYVR